MKIMFINAGPIQKFSTSLRALSFAECLARNNNFDIHCIFTYSDEDFRIFGNSYKGINLHYVKEISFLDETGWRYNLAIALYIFYGIKTAVKKRIKILEEINPDIIHIFKPHPLTWIPARIYQKNKHVKLVLDLDDTEYYLIKTNPYANFLNILLTGYIKEKSIKTCNYLTVANENFYHHYRNKVTNIEYLPNGVFIDRFNQNKKTLKKAYSIENHTVMLWSGVFIPWFKIDRVIKIFTEVKKVLPEAILILVGDGPERANLVELTKKLGVYQSVVFTGYIRPEKTAQFIQLADILLLPQEDTYPNRYRCPLKIREYLASGNPIVATAVGEVTVALENDSTQLIQPNSPEQEYVHKILKIAKDKTLQERIRKENIQKARKYSYEMLTRKLIDIYDHI